MASDHSGPAARLRAAAATLRAGAGHCAPDAHHHHFTATGEFVAVMAPRLAEPLAAWLELTANELDHGGPPPHGALMPHPRWQKPLAVASAILGGET